MSECIAQLEQKNMNIISVEIGRVVQLFAPDEMKPKHGSYRPDVVAAIANRYGFLQTPAINVSGSNENNTTFSEGQFLRRGEKINIKDLTIYTDGVAIEANSTDTAEIVMEDFVEWTKEEFSVSEPKTKIPRSFISGLVVDFDAPIDPIFSTIRDLQKILSAQYEAIYGASINLGISKVSLGTDALVPKGMLNSEFTIERRSGEKYSLNRYFSGAPLPTNIHIEILETFELLARKV